jgi:hypothetical protein
MDNKRLSYYSNLIGYIFTFMEVVDNGSILNEKALQNLEDAKKMAAEVVELPKEKRTEAITRALPGVDIERIGQHRIVTYKGKGFQVKNTGTPKRIEEIYQPLNYEDVQNFLLSHEVYNKIMRENRQ